MISKKNCYIGQNKPAYVVIHETDNWSKGANAKCHAQAMKNGNLAGTVHYYVDSENVYQTLDHNDGAWAVGDGKGKYGITNRNSINIEICVNPESDYYKAVDKAEQLAAYLLKQYGWGTDRLKRHYDASRKHCPRRILDEGLWPKFTEKTAAYMGTTSETTASTTAGGKYMFTPKIVKKETTTHLYYYCRRS
nr:N-acetylmuramoyl-L-alanine amidase [uncultured Blautia sp.]